MSARASAAFAAMSIIWGVSYLFVKIGVDDGVSPGFLSWARVALAAVVLLALAARAGTLRSLRGRWRWVLAYGVIEIAIPFPMIALGEQRISSSLAAIIIASVPLLVAVLAMRFDHAERARGRRLAGLLVGLAGVVALMGIDVAGRPSELLGAAAIFVAAAGYAVGPMLLKRHLAHLDSRATMGASLFVAAVLLTPAAALAPPRSAPPAGALWSMLVLGLICTAAAFVIFAILIVEIGPGRAAVITYVNPLVAVAAGVLFLDERPGLGAVLGLVLILAGSWLSTRAAPANAARVPARGRRLRA